ncbi:70-kilodalton heat shock protein, partial [Tulasnella sp. 408]
MVLIYTDTFKHCRATVFDANEEIDDLAAQLPTTVPVPIAYGLDKQGTGERRVHTFDPGGETFDQSTTIFSKIRPPLARAVRRLRTARERAKRTLPSAVSSITLARFEELYQHLPLEPQPAEKVLRDSKSAVNEIVLVGGSLVFLCIMKLVSNFNDKELLVPSLRLLTTERRNSPEAISAMVLGKMRLTAKAYLGEKVTHAVFIVPGYFNDAQRRRYPRRSDYPPYRQRTHHRPITYGLYRKNSRGADEFYIIVVY